MKYDWEVRTVPLEDLEKRLQQASAGGWEVFTIMPVEGTFVLVVRRPV